MYIYICIIYVNVLILEQYTITENSCELYPVWKGTVLMYYLEATQVTKKQMLQIEKTKLNFKLLTSNVNVSHEMHICV